MSYNSGVIVVISNQPSATRLADLKSLAQLLPELYSTQSYYHNKLKMSFSHFIHQEFEMINVPNSEDFHLINHTLKCTLITADDDLGKKHLYSSGRIV